jgi:probable rRNA maturation factor
MAAEGCAPEAEVSLLICGDRRMRRLNREWRGKDKTTDVLSFSQQETPKGIKVGIFPDSPNLLGDVIISAPSAEKQARKAGKTFSAEVNFLFGHGMLHLLGWRDDTPARRAAMLARQQSIMEQL